jgi:hypothetical protein
MHPSSISGIGTVKLKLQRERTKQVKSQTEEEDRRQKVTENQNNILVFAFQCVFEHVGGRQFTLPTLLVNTAPFARVSFFRRTIKSTPGRRATRHELQWSCFFAVVEPEAFYYAELDQFERKKSPHN